MGAWPLPITPWRPFLPFLSLGRSSEDLDRRRPIGADFGISGPAALVLAGSFLGLYLAKPPAAVAVAAACFFLLCFDPRLKTGLRACIRVAGIVLIVAVAGAALFFGTRPGFSVNRYFFMSPGHPLP